MAFDTLLPQGQLPDPKKRRMGTRLESRSTETATNGSRASAEIIASAHQHARLGHAADSHAYTESPPASCPDTTLLDLPAELLQFITSDLRGTNGILNLARANRRLKDVAQNAMLKDLIVSKNNLTQVLTMLARRLDRVPSILSIDLGNLGWPCSRYLLARPRIDDETFNLLISTVPPQLRHNLFVGTEAGKSDSGSAWRRLEKLYLNFLLSLCPNLRSLNFEWPGTDSFVAARPPRSNHLSPSMLPAQNPETMAIPPFEGLALQFLQQKLEELTISRDTIWKGPSMLETLTTEEEVQWRSIGKQSITLAGFQNLTRLDVPMSVLGQPQTIRLLETARMGYVSRANSGNDSPAGGNGNQTMQLPLHQSKIIPLTIKYLHLRDCNKHTFALLQKWSEISPDRLRLKLVEIFFKASPKAFISQCYIADEGKIDYLGKLSDLACRNVDVRSYTGSSAAAVDLRKELAHMSLLSPLEVWALATSSIQYSALKPESSIKRRFSMIGGCLFLRHFHDHLELFNSPNFDPTAWANVVFFRGAKDSKWDPTILPPNIEVGTLPNSQWLSRPLGMKDFKRRFPVFQGELSTMGSSGINTNVSTDISDYPFTFESMVKVTPMPNNLPALGTMYSTARYARSKRVDPARYLRARFS